MAVPAGGEREARFTLSVPDDASGGERYGIIWAESPSAGSGIGAASRVGIRVYLSVGGPEEPEPPTDFAIDSLIAARAEDGRPIVRARVANTGQRAVDLAGELHLSEGPAGLAAGPFPAERGTTLAPGDEGPMLVELDPQLPAGPWLARMVARSGSLEKAVEATIVFPDAAGESAEPVEATEVPLFRDRGFLLPLAIALVVLLVIGLGLAWWFKLRRPPGGAGGAPA